jgi:hypothetical protein
MDLMRALERELAGAYTNLYRIEVLKGATECRSLNILLDHLRETNEESLGIVFRILKVRDPGNGIRILQKGLQSKNKKNRANSIEALESYLHPKIGRVLIPFIDEIPVQEKLDLGRKVLSLRFPKGIGPQEVLDGLLDEDDPVTRMCTLYFVGESEPDNRFRSRVIDLSANRDPRLQEAALFVLRKTGTIDASREETGVMLNTMEKIIHLKKIQIFSGLQVRELTAISSITEEKEYPEGAVIIQEGDMADGMYLILEGEVSVIQDYGKPSEVLLGKIATDDYFGEMSLFDSRPRSTTVRADPPTRVLELGKFEFEEIMKEFPRIAISICQVYSSRHRAQHERLRELQERLSPSSLCPGS